MKMIIVLCLALNISFGQTLGNPGGGGPDGESPEKLCQDHQKSIEHTEVKFLGYWDIKNVEPTSHLEHLIKIEIELLTSFLGHLDINDQLQVGHCPVQKNRPPFNRPHYIQELTLLDEMIHELEMNSTLEGCIFFQAETRHLHLDRLKAIRKFYGKQ